MTTLDTVSQERAIELPSLKQASQQALKTILDHDIPLPETIAATGVGILTKDPVMAAGTFLGLGGIRSAIESKGEHVALDVHDIVNGALAGALTAISKNIASPALGELTTQAADITRQFAEAYAHTLQSPFEKIAMPVSAASPIILKLINKHFPPSKPSKEYYARRGLPQEAIPFMDQLPLGSPAQTTFAQLEKNTQTQLGLSTKTLSLQHKPPKTSSASSSDLSIKPKPTQQMKQRTG